MIILSPENTIKSADAPFFPSFSHIGLGLYHGLWSYDGWNQLNYVIEEIQNPEENLLKAILISLLVISGFYLFVNVFYISILGTEAILASEAVATEYAAKILPQVSFIIPIMVACSCLGAALVQVSPTKTKEAYRQNIVISSSWSLFEQGGRF